MTLYSVLSSVNRSASSAFPSTVRAWPLGGGGDVDVDSLDFVVAD